MTDANVQGTGGTLGNKAQIVFHEFGDKAVEGKIDTGATTSSLHASDIKVDQGRRTVSFRSDVLSPHTVTLDLDGVQEVHSADAGGVSRPTVTFDISIDGKQLRQVAFNLNDRENMDTRVLIGQNALKAGGFMIDPSKDDAEGSITREQAILNAVQVLTEYDVTLAQIVKHMQTIATNNIRAL